MTPKGWSHSKTVVDGIVQYLSASGLQKGDPETEQGCPRRWRYHYMLDIREAETESLARGKRCHSEVEGYLTTGSRAGLCSQVISGLHNVPKPGPGLEVEASLVPINIALADADNPFGREDLNLAPLRAADIPIVGRMDLVNYRCTNQGASDIEDTIDPPGTIEIIDWKFTGDLRFAKTPAELPKTIQMALYAKYMFTVKPDCEIIRLSHGYFPAKGSPKKVTTRVNREQIEPTWKHIDHLAGSLRDVAAMPNIDDVPANTRACYSFGRACPALKVCKAPMHNSLASRIGQTSNNKFLAHIQGNNMTAPTANPTSLSARLAAARAALTTPATTPAPAASAADVQAEMRRLAQAEARSKYPTVEKTCADIRAVGLGFPTLCGFAAGAYGHLFGITPEPRGTDHFIDGEGEIAGYVIPEIAQLTDVLSEVLKENALRTMPSGAVTTQTEPVAAFLSPETPASNPALASKTVELAPPAVTDAASAITAAVAETPKKRGPKKSLKSVADTQAMTTPAPVETAPAGPLVSQAPEPTIVVGTTPEAAPVIARPGAINLFLNCAIDNLETKSLAPLVNKVCEFMVEDCGVKAGEGDFRNAPMDSKYAYNKWRGIMSACLDIAPIEGGNYRYDNTGGDIGLVVVEVMKNRVSRTGGFIVSGNR